MTAKLISFEGIDGSGKSTLLKLSAEKLKELGYKVLTVQEPGTTDMGLQIRSLIKSDINRSPLSEVMLFMASRADMVENVIRPALEQYDFVLMDRFIDSTIAYQGYGNGNDIEMLKTLNSVATGNLIPDKTIYVHVPLNTAQARAHARGDITDKFDIDLAFAKRVYDGYAELITDSRFIVVENTKTLEKALETCVKHLTN